MRKGCVSCVSLALPPPPLSEEKYKRRRGQEGKRARGQEGKRARGQEDKRARGQEGKRARGEDVKMWGCEDVKMRRYEDVKMWRWAEDEQKMSRRWAEDEKMWRWEDERQNPTIGRTLRSDALGKNIEKRSFSVKKTFKQIRKVKQCNFTFCPCQFTYVSDVTQSKKELPSSRRRTSPGSIDCLQIFKTATAGLLSCTVDETTEDHTQAVAA